MSKSDKTQFATEAYEEFREGADLFKKFEGVPEEQVIHAMRIASGILGQGFDITYIKKLKDINEKLEMGHKFRLPFNGLLLGGAQDKKSFAYIIKNFLQAQRLPFPVISIEYETDIPHGEHKCKGVVLLAEEIERPERFPLIKLQIFKKMQSYREGRYVWSALKYEFMIDFEKITSDDDTLFDFATINTWENTDTPTPQRMENLNAELKAFLEFLLALSCKNTEVQEAHPVSQKIIKMREKKGLKPLPKYNEIVINTSANKPGVAGESRKGGYNVATHARRGHIRRLNGSVTWVTATVVNAHLGDIQKDKTYRLK